MLTLTLFTSLLGVCLAVAIVWLVRKGHLHASSALFWLGTALAALVLGLWPGLIDHIATFTGIAYPPALLLLCGLSALLIKCLHADVKNTQLERDLRRLNQHVAILELSNCNEQKQTPFINPP